MPPILQERIIDSNSYKRNDRTLRPVYQVEDLRSKLSVRNFDVAPTNMSTEFSNAADAVGRQVLQIYGQSGQGNNVDGVYRMAIDATISSAFGLDYRDVARNHKYYATMFAGENVEDRGFVEALSKAWESENLSRDIAFLQNRFDMSRDSEERNRLLKEIENTELKLMQSYDYTDRGWLGNSLVNTAPIMNQLTRTLATTYVPAVLMGSLATLATGGAAAPAAVGGIIRAITASRAFRGWKTAGRVTDLLVNSFARIRGNTSRELYNLVDENGNRLPDNIRNNTAAISGLLQTAVEYFLPEPGLEKLIPNGLSRLMQGTIIDQTKSFFGRMASRSVLGAVSESTEEAVQSLIADVSESIAKTVSNSYGKTEFRGRPIGEAIASYLSNAWQSFSQAFVPSLIAGVPGTVLTTASESLISQDYRLQQVTPEMRASAEQFQRVNPDTKIVSSNVIRYKRDAPSTDFIGSISTPNADGTSTTAQTSDFAPIRVRVDRKGMLIPIDAYNENLAKYLHNLGAIGMAVDIVNEPIEPVMQNQDVQDISNSVRGVLDRLSSTIRVSDQTQAEAFVSGLEGIGVSVNRSEDGSIQSITYKSPDGTEKVVSIVVDSATQTDTTGQDFDNEFNTDESTVKPADSTSENGVITKQPSNNVDVIGQLAADLTRTSRGRIDATTARALASLYSIMPEGARNELFSRHNGRLVFNDRETGRTLPRNRRGATLTKSLQVILNERSDADTFIHESTHLVGHAFPETFRRIARAFHEALSDADDRETVIDFLDENREIIKMDYTTALGILESLPDDGNFTEAQEELIADIAIANGRSNSAQENTTLPQRMREALAHLAQAIQNVYRRVTGKTVLPQNVQAAFNEMFLMSEYSDKDVRFQSEQNMTADVQMSWEVAPSISSNILSGYFDAPVEQQQSYLDAIIDALTDENGNDIIAEIVGLDKIGNLKAPGYFEGNTSLGVQSIFRVPVNENGIPLPEAQEALNAYAEILGYLLFQDSVAWNMAIEREDSSRDNAHALEMGRPLSVEEIRLLGNLLEQAAAEIEPDFNVDSIGLVSNPEGVYMPLFGDNTNNAYDRIVSRAIDLFGENLDDSIIVTDKGYQHYSGYIENEGGWEENTHGEGYTRRARNAGRSDLFETAVLRAGSQTFGVSRAVSEAYGWGEYRDIAADWYSEDPGFQDRVNKSYERALARFTTDIRYQSSNSRDITEDNVVSWGIRKYQNIPDEQLSSFIENNTYVPDYVLKYKLARAMEDGSNPNDGLAYQIRGEITAREQLKTIPSEERNLAFRENITSEDEYISAINALRQDRGEAALDNAREYLYRKFYSYATTPTVRQMVNDFKNRFGSKERLLAFKEIASYRLVQTENGDRLNRVNSQVANILADLNENSTPEQVNNILKSIDSSPRMWLKAYYNSLSAWEMELPFNRSLDLLLNYLYMSDNEFDYIRSELRKNTDAEQQLDDIEVATLQSAEQNRLSEREADIRLQQEMEEQDEGYNTEEHRLYSEANRNNISKLKDDMRVLGKTADREMNKRRELEAEIDSLLQQMSAQEAESEQKLFDTVTWERWKAATREEDIRRYYKSLINAIKFRADERNRSTRERLESRLDNQQDFYRTRLTQAMHRYYETRTQLQETERALRRARRKLIALQVKYTSQKIDRSIKKMLNFNKNTHSAEIQDSIYYVYYLMHDGQTPLVNNNEVYTDADYQMQRLVSGEAESSSDTEVMLYAVDSEGNPIEGAPPFQGDLSAYRYDRTTLPPLLAKYLTSNVIHVLNDPDITWNSMDLATKREILDALYNARKDAAEAYMVANDHRHEELRRTENELAASAMRESGDFMTVSDEDRERVARVTHVDVSYISDEDRQWVAGRLGIDSDSVADEIAERYIRENLHDFALSRISDDDVMDYKRKHPDEFIAPVDESSFRDKFITPFMLWGKMIEPFVRKIDGRKRGAFYQAFVARPLEAYQEKLRQKNRRLAEANDMFTRTLGEQGSDKRRESTRWLQAEYDIQSNVLKKGMKKVTGTELLGAYIYAFNINGFSKLYSPDGNSISLDSLARINPEALLRFIEGELQTRTDIALDRDYRLTYGLVEKDYPTTLLAREDEGKLRDLKRRIESCEIQSIIPENIREAGKGMIDLLRKEQGRYAQVAFSEHNVKMVFQEYYFPLVAQGRLSSGDITKMVKKSQKSVFSGNKELRDKNARYPLKLDPFSVFLSAIETQEQFINMTRSVRDMNSMMSVQGGIKSVIQNRYGEKYADYLQNYINSLAGDAPNLDDAEKLLNNIFGNIAVSKIGLNFMTSIKQLVSIIPAVTSGEINAADFFSSAIEMTGHYDSIRKFIQQEAPEIMRSSVNIEIDRLRDSAGGNPLNAGMNRFRDIMMKPIEATDRFVKMAVWYSSYKKNLGQGLSKREAVSRASMLVQQTQSMSDPFSTAPAQRSRNPFARISFLFTNDLFHIWNYIYGDTYLDWREGGEGRLRAIEKLAGVALSAGALAFLSAGWLPDEDEDDSEWSKLFKDFGIQMAQYVTPVFGSGWQSVFSGYDNSIFSFPKDFFRTGKMVYQTLSSDREYSPEEWFSQIWDTIGSGVSAVAPYPYVFAGRMVDAFMPDGKDGLTFNPWYFLGTNVGRSAEVTNGFRELLD